MTLTAVPATRPAAKATRLTPLVCFGIPLAILVGSYIWLAIDNGSFTLWNVVVHENGRRTFGQTVFYFSHFLREVPVDIAYALFLIGASGGLDVSRDGAAAERAQRIAWLGLGTAVLLVMAALLAVASSAGWRSALLDLFQFRTRDELVAYGSHWRFHWLSTLWFGALLGCAPALARWFHLRVPLGRSRAWWRAAWVYFVVLSGAFGVTAAVFTDPRYLGHQAREIMTHGPVTALLGLGVLVLVRAQTYGSPPMSRSVSRSAWLWGTLLVGIPMFLVTKSLTGDVLSAGQTDQGLAAMVAAHYFEHTLDYLLVGLLVLAGAASRIALWPILKSRIPERS